LTSPNPHLSRQLLDTDSVASNQNRLKLSSV